MILFSSQNQKTEDESEKQAVAHIKCPKGKKQMETEFRKRRHNTRNNRVTIAPPIRMEKLQKILY